MYVYSTDNGITWSSPINVSRTDSLSSDEPNLVVDNNNILHCVWRQAYTIEAYWYMDLFYSYCSSGVWFNQVNISRDSGGNTSYYSSLVIDSYNHVHVVGDQQTGASNWDIFYSYKDGDTWSTPYNISQDPYDSAFPSLAIDDSNYLHLVWRKLISGRPIMYSKYNGTNWSPPEVITDTFFGSSANIVVDSRNNPHVITYYCYYTKKINNQWSYPIRIHNMSSTFYCSYSNLAIDIVTISMLFGKHIC